MAKPIARPTGAHVAWWLMGPAPANEAGHRAGRGGGGAAPRGVRAGPAPPVGGLGAGGGPDPDAVQRCRGRGSASHGLWDETRRPGTRQSNPGASLTDQYITDPA